MLVADAVVMLVDVSDGPYRISEPKPPVLPPDVPPPGADPYLLAWRRLRRWRRLVVVGVASYIGVIFFVAPLLDAWCIPFAAASMLLWAVSSIGATFFSCPRCRQLFAMDGLVGPGTLYRSTCLHCGIAVGTPKE